LFGFEYTEVILLNKPGKEGKELALKVFFYQSIVVTFMTITVLIFFEKLTAFSYFYGGLVNIITSGVFGFFAFRFSGARQNELVVQSFSRGTKLKLYITVLMAAVAFSVLSVEPAPLFIGFMVSNVCQWAAMLNTKKMM
jgi:ATP synthase protein I